MKVKKTGRGFEFVEFKDEYGENCSLQISSRAGLECVWLGIDKASVKVLKMNEGWVDCELPPGAEIFSRMHLTRKQVEKLLPHLQAFVEKGEIKP